MSLPFDPAELSVKDALKASSALSDDELDALYESELDGKTRKGLLDGLTQLREDLRAAAVAVVEAPAAPAVAEEAPAPEIHPWAVCR